MGNDEHACAQVGNADGRGLRLPDGRGVKDQDIRREQADSRGFSHALHADCGRGHTRVVCGQGDDPLCSPFADGVKRQFDLRYLRDAQIKGRGRQDAELGIVGDDGVDADGQIAAVFNGQTAHDGVSDADIAKVDLRGSRVKKGHAKCGIAQFADAVVVDKNEIALPVDQQARGALQIGQEAEGPIGTRACDARSREGQHDACFRFYGADAVVARVRDVNIAERVCGNARRIGEQRARRRPPIALVKHFAGDRFSPGRGVDDDDNGRILHGPADPADAPIGDVCDQQVAIAGDDELPGGQSRAVRQAAILNSGCPWVAIAGHGADGIAHQIELSHAVVALPTGIAPI